MAGFTSRRVAANGITMNVEVGGSGPTMVLLHGWPQTGYAWRRVMPALAETHTVVVPDLRGAGDSDVPDHGYRKLDQAEDLRQLLAALDLHGPAIVVGHDIGAMVAFAWALAHPEDVAALVLLDAVLPGLGLEEAMDVANGGMWHFGFFGAPWPIPELLMDGHEREFFTASFSQMSAPGTFADADLDVYVRAYEGRERLRGGFEQYRALLDDGRDVRARLGTPLPMPVLAVGGGEPLRPHAPRLVTADAPAGHFIPEEAPDWLVAQLRALG